MLIGFSEHSRRDLDRAMVDIFTVQYTLELGMAQRFVASQWVHIHFSYARNILLTLHSELPSGYKGVKRVTYGREVYYDLPDPQLKQATQWLISNPNRVNLGRIGLKYKGVTLNASEITDPRQQLELWDGTITSTFQIGGTDVKVVTQGDFDSDAVALSIESDHIQSGDLQVELDFPYPPIHTTKYKYEVYDTQKPQ
jgi:hypothetical protein